MNPLDVTPPWVDKETWANTWDGDPTFFMPDYWAALYLTTVDPTLAPLREQAEARLMSLSPSFAEVPGYLGDLKETLTAYSVGNLMDPGATWADAATMATDRDLLAILILTGEWLKAHGGRLHELDRTLVSLREEAMEMDKAMMGREPRDRIQQLLALEPPWELRGRLPILLPEVRRLTVPKARGPWALIVKYPTLKP